MSTVITYKFNGKNYDSVWALRNAVWEESRIVFKTPTSKEEWTKIGVRYLETEVVPKPPTPQEESAKKLSRAKRLRTVQVDTIVVTVNGKKFNGDEYSQSRMVRIITANEHKPIQNIRWVLSDDTVADVTVDELKEALYLSVVEMEKVWAVPYEVSP